MEHRSVTEVAQKRPNAKRRWLGWLLRVAGAVLLLSLLSAKVDVKGVFAVLHDIDFALWSLSLALYFVFRGILSCQMSLGLSPLGMDVTVPQLFKITLIAGFYALILPGTLLAGSAASWYKLSRYGNKGMASAVLVVYYRIVNTLTLLGIGLVAVCLDARSWIRAWRLPALGMFMACLLLFLPFLSQPVARLAAGVTESILRSWRLPRWLDSKVREGQQAVFRFRALGPSQIVLIFALSLLANGVAVATWCLLAEAVGMRLPVLVIAWISSFLSIVQMIPVSIGGLGLREVSLVALVRDHGIAETQAVGFSLAVFSLMIVSGLVGGVLEVCDVLFSRHPTEGTIALERTDVDTHSCGSPDCR